MTALICLSIALVSFWAALTLAVEAVTWLACVGDRALA